MYRILIADDEILMRKGLCTLIDWQKFDCQIVGTAENGLQAKQAVIDLQPDILIADIKMPLLDGLELAQWIHTSQLQVQIILLTALAIILLKPGTWMRLLMPLNAVNRN